MNQEEKLKELQDILLKNIPRLERQAYERCYQRRILEFAQEQPRDHEKIFEYLLWFENYSVKKTRGEV